MLSDFDDWALNHLKQPLILKGLRPRDSCNISKLVFSHFDSLVEHETSLTVVPPYIVRNYRLAHMSFSLVRDSNNVVHLVHHAIIWKIYNDYRPYEFIKSVDGIHESPMRLKGKIDIMPFNDDALSFMYSDPDFMPVDEFDRQEKLSALVAKIYNLENRTYLGDVVSYLDKRSADVTEACMDRVMNLYNGTGYLSEVFELKGIGYVILELMPAKRPEMFFVPFKERIPAFRIDDMDYAYFGCDTLR